MLGDYSRDLLRSGIIELKAGNLQAARRYLDRALYMSNDHDVMAEAWYWMSQAVDDAGQKRLALENCLANDLQHARARRALAILDGRLKPEEIIDPDAAAPLPASEAVQAQRFVCSRCGGRMVFAPDGRALVCEYCLRHQLLGADASQEKENDFVLAMATRRGHGKPLRGHIVRCQGCGAAFVLPAGRLSFTCAYCESPYVVSVDQSRDLLAPDGIIPHAFDQRHAKDLLIDRIENLKIEPDTAVGAPHGLYLPIWSFELGGEIDYVGEVQADERDALLGRSRKTVQVHDRHAVMLTVSVAASRRPSAPLVRLIPGFDLAAVQPYDPRFLADWPAELYDVPMAEASLEARSQAYAGVQRDLPVLLEPLRLLSTSSANMTVESFRLDLLPVWMTEVRLDGRGHIVLINGQSGALQDDGFRRIKGGKKSLMTWLGDLVAE